MLKWLLLIAVLGYGGLLALVYVAQRSMEYFPERARTAPATVGLPGAKEIDLPTEDGEQVIAWHIAPRGGKSLVLYFHGNGGSLAWRAERFRALTADGTGLLALSYRGYAGSSGLPTEAGLIKDAFAAYAFAAARYPPGRIALWGESLGSAVAIALAAEKPVTRIVLEAPFTSITDVAARLYWFLPVRWLIKDAFHSDQRAGKVTAPVLILHGERDAVVPIVLGERLYARINAPKEFARFPAAGHNDLGAYGALDVARKFLDKTEPWPG